jgi:uncharacterized LabA/DUF88 family protein
VPTPENARIAILIDADNTSKKYVEILIEEIAKYGTPTVKRAYGDWTSNHLSGWKNELNRNAIVPVQQFAYTQGKNSTDSLLIIDAMDLLYTGNLDGFAIVSSDSDFTSLATRLREAGKAVYGLGQRKTPEPFRTACTRFIFLEVLDKDEPVEADADSSPLPDLEKLLASAINATAQDDGWAHLGSLGSYLNTTHSSFDPRNYGFGRLITLLRDQPYLDVDTEVSPRVRLRSHRPAERTTGSAASAAKKTSAKKTTARKTAARKTATKA